MTALTYTAVAGRPHRAYLKYLEIWLPKAIAMIAKPPAEVSVVLLGDMKMAALHEQFMAVPGTTDVLTFEIDHDARGRCTSGEVVICVSYAKREANRRGLAVENELLLYALHGVLHLSGFDDLDPKAHRRMHDTEDRILRAIGVGAVFARAGLQRSLRSRLNKHLRVEPRTK